MLSFHFIDPRPIAPQDKAALPLIRNISCLLLAFTLLLGTILLGNCRQLASEEYGDLEKGQKALRRVSSSSPSKAPKRIFMSWKRTKAPLYEINFGRKYSSQGPVYFNELEAWARNRNLVLLPDLALRGLKDFEGTLIPSSGLRFHLDAPVFSRVYLYLDLATYKALGKIKLPRTALNWLEIIVNGHSLKIVYQGYQSGPFIQSPLVVPVELEQISKEGKLEILLRPDPHTSYGGYKARFAIWDAFVSSQHPSLN